MKKTIFVKPILNKLNKQVNISLPKKQLPKDFFKDLPNKRLLKIILEDF
jgi:hypothetical protein